ncbi:hypothetical protein BGZ96_006141 [Linnemannia gamsii]|uniref:Uncharacterized protein n=1 Tax=Linnemannia gamsii TaxID=64522 RepID=A0ABQ7K3C9_9FUNG|nr:hypothetical protein BGZ96_006141 [Linnemannia gamsii]
MTKPSLFSQRRTLQRRNTTKREAKLDKVFDCLNCNHSKCVICKLDFGRKVGTLICETCPARYSCIINHLSKEIDVYSEWVDSLETPKQLAQTKSCPQATLTAAPPPASVEPLVGPTHTKTSSLLSATSRAQNHAQAHRRPSRSQSRSPLLRSEAPAPVHDRPNREQSLASLPGHEQSYSPLLSPRLQAQAQSSLSVPKPVQVQLQPQPHVKERVAANVSLYHDQNDDNASQMLQPGTMTATAVDSPVTVSPGQPWVQGNSREHRYSERQYHGFNQQQDYENDTNLNYQGLGSYNNYNNDHENHGFSFQIQSFGFINPRFGDHQGFGGNSQGYGGIQNFGEINQGFGGNQGYGNSNNQRLRNNNQRFRNNNQAYGTNNNQGRYGANSQISRNNKQAYYDNNNQAYETSNQGNHGAQLSANYNNNSQNNDMISSSSYSSGYYNNNTGGGNLSDYDAYSPASNTEGSSHDYANGSSTEMLYNTTGGYSDH